MLHDTGKDKGNGMGILFKGLMERITKGIQSTYGLDPLWFDGIGSGIDKVKQTLSRYYIRSPG